MTRKVVEATRSYLELPHFNRDIIQNKSKAAAGLCDWAINIVKYFDVVIDVAPKKAELAEANAKLADANETLEVVMSKVCCSPRLSFLKQEQNRDPAVPHVTAAVPFPTAVLFLGIKASMRQLQIPELHCQTSVSERPAPGAFA